MEREDHHRQQRMQHAPQHAQIRTGIAPFEFANDQFLQDEPLLSTIIVLMHVSTSST